MFENLITVVLQLFCSFLVVTGLFQSYNVNQDNGPLGKITIDKKSGYLYVGGNNILLQLDSNLSIISEVTVGPILDNSKCYPLPVPCTYQRDLTDNKIHVLAINEPNNYILACGTANHGLCTAYSLSDIGAMNKTLNPMKATNNIVGSVSGSSYSNSYAFFGSTHSVLQKENPDNQLLYVAMGTANQSLQFTPAMISSREINSSSNTWNIDYFLNSLTSSSFMNVKPSLQYNFRSYYIYGFENSGYTYFISVQMNDPTAFEAENNRFVTKIIRICQDDEKYSSYTELPIECTHGDKKYQIATSAKLSDYGYLPFEKFLYITFGKQDELNPSPDRSQGSVMCTFEFNKITELFEKLLQDCFTSGIGNEVAWFVGKSLTEARACARDTGQDLKNFCGGKKNLFGIQESTNLDQRRQQTLTSSAIYHEAKSILSSVNVIHQNKENVAVLGTDEGYLMKVLVKKPAASLPSPYMTYDITKDRKVKIEPGAQTDSSGTSVYLLSNTQVIKFPLDACEVHTTCEQCVGVDPLGCGWCGNKCTSQKTCSSGWSGQSCPPIITMISPMSGPTNGGTLLTLEGQNFGTMSPDFREITIGKNNCFTTTFITSTKITCVTEKMTVEGEGQIKVIVNDSNNTPYQINGEYTSPDFIFSYKSPKVLDFTPKYGPLSGGTKLVISGKNLNVGAKHSVLVAGQKCVIEPSGGIQDTSLTCLTPKLLYSKRKRKRDTSPSPVYDVSIRLDIDGFTYQFNESYQFMEDSTVTSIGPHKSIQAGGTTVTVTGTNLHIISEPMIIASLVYNNNNKQTVPVACYNSSQDGTTLLCPAPSITAAMDNNALPCCGYKSVYLSFIMDGIQSVKQLPQSMSYMHYFLNPVFLPFAEDEHIRYFLITEERLEIKGEHLHYGVTTKDVTVTIGNSICEVTVMRATVLYCTPKDKPSSVGDDDPKRTVKVKVGYMTYDIGQLVYTQEIASAMSPGIIAMAVILALVVLCIIVLVYIMKRQEIGPFKRSPDKHGAQYAAGREVAFTGLDSAGQRVFDMENAQNESTKIKVSEKISEVKIIVTDTDSLSEKKAYAEQRMSGELPYGAESRSPILLDDDTLLVLKDKNLLIEREWLTLGEIIGKGHFGCVYRGYLEVPNVKGSQLVAVKTLHQDDPRQLDVDSFIEEALRMKDFHNPNVLTLTGICFGMDDMPLVILPFMTHGDLLSYIRKEENNPTIKDLILFGIDIARGMEYLSGCKFVHRDLAARNCMLDENFRAVVGDFGLSRDIYAKDYYASENKKTKLPVKWMAPECLEKGHYSVQSDVWSFGVVLWELMTRGVNPYPEVDNWDVLRYIKKGRRMPQPPFCPDILYKMMSKCWSFNPNDRPKFSELVHEINEMINVLEQQMKQGQHTTDIQSTYVNTDTCTDYHYHDNKHPVEETEAITEAENLC
ncbi:hepatocyte growth factor receptor-like isoform X1 [Mytilus trossulus]|uniref:hepatocyte growth factor receptor-like isoform X1 n=1 Tax=Mytilus trossulus TaxID=6551 RepID=UPI0030075A99